MFRQVKQTKKTQNDILIMGGKWGTVTKEEAIQEIANSVHRYYVRADGSDMNVTTIYTPYGYCLSTTPVRSINGSDIHI